MQIRGDGNRNAFYVCMGQQVLPIWITLYAWWQRMQDWIGDRYQAYLGYLLPGMIKKAAKTWTASSVPQIPKALTAAFLTEMG